MHRKDVPRFIGTYLPRPNSLPYLSGAFIEAAKHPQVDMIELRADNCSPRKAVYLAKAIKQHTKKPVLATVRHASEVGYFPGTENQRLDMYRELIHHVDAVDVELYATRGDIFTDTLGVVSRLAKREGKLLFVSSHPSDISKWDLEMFIEDAKKAGADLAKYSPEISCSSQLNALKKDFLKVKCLDFPISINPRGVDSVNNKLHTFCWGAYPLYGNLGFGKIVNQPKLDDDFFEKMKVAPKLY